MKWLETWEVNKEGNYLMHRIDDVTFGVLEEEFGTNVALVVYVTSETNKAGNTEYVVSMPGQGGVSQPVTTLDSECRLFGPIPTLVSMWED